MPKKAPAVAGAFFTFGFFCLAYDNCRPLRNARNCIRTKICPFSYPARARE